VISIVSTVLSVHPFFSSPRGKLQKISTSPGGTEEALTVLADSCIASAEKDFSSKSPFEGIRSPNTSLNDTSNPNIFAGFADISALEGNDTSMDNSLTISSPVDANVTLGTATKRKHYRISNYDDSDNNISTTNPSLSSSLLTDKEASISINDSMISVDDSITEERDGNVLFKRHKKNSKKIQHMNNTNTATANNTNTIAAMHVLLSMSASSQ